MTENDFIERLVELRNIAGVSAREMSLSIGQNAGYISNIESGKSLPSMDSFFNICEYLKITPRDFFDTRLSDPEEIRRMIELLNKLNPKVRGNVELIIHDLLR